MRATLVMLTTTILTAALGGDADAQDTKVDGKLLTGKWTTSKEKSEKYFFIEFDDQSKISMYARYALVEGKKQELKVEGTYRLDGAKLEAKITTVGHEKTSRLTVKSLTTHQLVILQSDSTDEMVLYRIEKQK